MAMSGRELHNQPYLKVLNTDQIEQIHLATLAVLEHTGIQVTHARALELLDGAGASVDGNRVRLPAQMVEEAINAAPFHFTLNRRDGEIAFMLEDHKSWYGAGLDCMEYLDPITDDRRLFTSEDCRVTATIANALPNYSWSMLLGFAADAPVDIANRVAARQALTYCEKPLFFCCEEISSLRAIYEMATLIAGGAERFRQTPSIAALSSARSPLCYDDGTLDKIIFCAQKGIPQVLYPGLQAGATSPATFAGTIVQGSAESLGGLVIAQLVRTGTPVVYGALTTIMDMVTAVFSYGAPEMSLMTAAMSQMAKHYHLPFFGTAGCSDAKFPDDPQAVVEGTVSCLNSALSGANLVHDHGFLDHSALISPHYLVLIDEVLSMVNQYMRGIPVNADTLALDVIDQVGPGGHFLEEEHTMRHFRNVWYSDLFDRSTFDKWREQGSTCFTERLREKTRKLMDHHAEPLPAEIIREMDHMEKQWHKESRSKH
ncbi:MAG: trimethylamine methyltransferase family protein [Desulfobacterales bacterium]|jgi:trimethylamine--corrinoid protein Co-methyltransferase